MSCCQRGTVNEKLDGAVRGGCRAPGCVSSAEAQAPKTLRVVMHSDIKVLDPVWSGAYIVRNHGYLVYDTLFALDEKFQPSRR